MERSIRQPTATTTSLRTPTAYANPFATPQAQAIIAPYLADRQMRTPAIAPAPGFISGYNPDAPYSMVGPGGMQWSNTVPSRALSRTGTPIAMPPMPTAPGGAPLPGVPVGAFPRPVTPGGTVPAIPFPGTGTPATPAVPGTPGTPGVDAVPAQSFEEWRNGQLIKQVMLRQAQAAVAATPAVPAIPARPAGR